MVAISLSGSGEGPGWVTAPGYSTQRICRLVAMSDNAISVQQGRGEGEQPRTGPLLALNVAAAAIVALSLWIGELPEHRKPFGPFTEIADFLGFLDERTRQGRFLQRLRSLGLLD
jgi:hypothetical protein